MPCSPVDNQVNPTPLPPPVVPGFGVPTSPIQIPLESLGLPTELIEDIVGLTQKISAQFPSGIFKSNADTQMKNVLDFVGNVLTQISPFLSFYNFIIALLKIVPCIIEILCAAPNPFLMANKLKVLFTECLPPYLNLFPFSALAIMIISLLLLILAIIEYLINLFIGIIDQIVTNIRILGDGITLNDAQSTLAAVNKIAALLCSIENLLSIFIALAAVLAIIESLAKLAGFGICSDEDPDGCCDSSICPNWIKETPDGIIVANGSMKYTSQIGIDLSGSLPPTLAALLTAQVTPLRAERWQIFANETLSYPISVIITPIIDHIFWPEEISYFPADSSVRRAPYTADLTVTLDPATLGHADLLGSRVFQIKDCIVVRKPYLGVLEFNNDTTEDPSTGTLNVEGGLVFEADGTTPYELNGIQATLNTFIHKASSTAENLPGSDDSLNFDISFVWKPNAPSLAGFQLTTIGCIPEVSIEKAVQNAVLTAEGTEAIIDKIPPTPAGVQVPSSGNFLPNVNGTLTCISNAIATFRTGISALTAAEFQAALQVCLGDLQNQTLATLCATLIASVSQFKSTIALETDLQFVTRPIEVTVTLKDSTGSNLGLGIPLDCAEQMANKLLAIVSFGEISSFEYDATLSAFVAQLTADQAGAGTIQVTFDSKVLSTVIPGVVGGSSSVIEPNELSYQFVAEMIEPPVRRDSTDLASV